MSVGNKSQLRTVEPFWRELSVEIADDIAQSDEWHTLLAAVLHGDREPSELAAEFQALAEQKYEALVEGRAQARKDMARIGRESA